MIKDRSKRGKLAAISLVSLLIIIFVMAIYIFSYPGSTVGTSEENQLIKIRPGTSFYSVAGDLKEKGVIENIRKFYIYARVKGDLKKIKAGEYLIEPLMTPRQILAKLVDGKVINHKVTISEGLNLYQIADIMEENGFVSKNDFIAKAFDHSLMNKLKINGPSFEGYLYPETYFFVKGMNAEEIISHMVARFRKVFTEEYDKRTKEIGFSREETIILASIIEKETANPDERPLISAVFHNRLKKKIRLQTDPTVIYGMMDKFDGNLRKKDLRKKTPYNTYRINGFPPGPIANPGIESIKAALYPANVDYIYFVSMNNGSHVFSKTLKEHNRSVWKYQKRKKGKKDAGELGSLSRK